MVTILQDGSFFLMFQNASQDDSNGNTLKIDSVLIVAIKNLLDIFPIRDIAKELPVWRNCAC